MSQSVTATRRLLRLLRLLIVCCLSLLSAGMVQAADEVADTGLDPQWRLVSDRDGIKIYTRHQDDYRLKTFRGSTVLDLPDEYALAAAINDYEQIPRWLHLVDGVTEIRRDGPLVRYMHLTTAAPWPLMDRDAVVRVTVPQRLTPKEESVTLLFENMPNLIPQDPSYVRFPELDAKLKLRRLGGNKVELTYEVVLDPGGYIPAWLVNILAKDVPYFTLKKLRVWVQRSEYQGKFYDYLELRGPGRPADLMPPRSYIYGFPPNQPFPAVPQARINELRR